MTKEQEVIKRLNFHKEYARLSSNRVVISETDLETVLSMLREKDTELKKKDKIIDLMATFIDAQNTRMLEDEYTAIKNIYTIIGFDKDKEGIKQYFGSKVKK